MNIRSIVIAAAILAYAAPAFAATTVQTGLTFEQATAIRFAAKQDGFNCSGGPVCVKDSGFSIPTGGPNTGSTGSRSTAYGECGNGWWSNPVAGICNISITDSMNNGRDSGQKAACRVQVITLSTPVIGVGPYTVTKQDDVKSGSC